MGSVYWSHLFDGEAEESRRGIWRWWSERRIRFNILVGAVGIVTWLLVLLAGGAAVKPGVDFEEPLAMIFGPFVYGLVANIFFTLGPVIDTLLHRRSPTRGLFKAGVIFSMALTALPGVWALFCFIHSVVTGQKLN